MKKESVFFTITLSFIISLLLVVVSFSVIVINKQVNDEDTLKKKYFPIVNKFLSQYKTAGTNPMFLDEFEEMSIKIVNDRKIRSALLYNPKTKVLIQRELKTYLIRVISLNKTNYIFIKNKNSKSSVDAFILIDNNSQESKSVILYVLIFGIVLIMLILSYLTTLRKLYPLKTLREKIPHLANENFDFECCDTTKRDEVSLLALEFKETALKLGELKESRNIFLSDLMREVNAAVIEGKELIKSSNTEENVKKVNEVFNKLDILIDDFSSMKEMIISNKKDIEINHFYLEEIIDKALFKLGIEKSSIEDNSQNIKLLVNDTLFSVAIKNLIDNAIKYSPNHKAVIYTQDENIMIQNIGDELPYELNTYFTPYLKEEDKINENFGLGLYIVHNILKSNDYRLDYEYQDGSNIFKCLKN